MIPADFFPLLREEREQKQEQGPDGRGIVAYLKMYNFLYRRKHGGASSDASN